MPRGGVALAAGARALPAFDGAAFRVEGAVEAALFDGGLLGVFFMGVLGGSGE